MTFFNSLLNLFVFLGGFALLVFSLYLKYNQTFSCILDYNEDNKDLQAKRDTAKVCIDIIVYMSIAMLLLPLGCYVCAGEGTFTSKSRADEVWAFGKLGTLPLAFAGLMGLTIIVCGSILYSYEKVSGFGCKDSVNGMMGPNTALQWILTLGSGMALFGLGGAFVHHRQLVKTENTEKGEDGIELGKLMPGPRKSSFGQRRSRFSNRSR